MKVAAGVHDADLRLHAAGPRETFPVQTNVRARVGEIAHQHRRLTPVRAEACGEGQLSRHGSASFDAPGRFHETLKGTQGLVCLQRNALLGEDAEPTQLAVEKIADIHRRVLQLQQRRCDERGSRRTRHLFVESLAGSGSSRLGDRLPRVAGEKIPFVQVALGFRETLGIQEAPDSP